VTARRPRRPLKPIAAVASLSLLGACATTRDRAGIPVDHVIVGHVVAATEQQMVVGDVFDTQTVYTVERFDQRGMRIDIVSGVTDCPASGKPNQLYLFLANGQYIATAQGNRTVWGIRGSNAFACFPIDRDTADGIIHARRYPR
jgi:hypothetical protein